MWLWAAAAAAAYAALSQALARRARPDAPDALHEVRTPDGRLLELAEYGRAGSRGAVYLQHGLGSTRQVFDLHPHGPSPARWLAARGWRVFAGNLRGRPPDEGPRSFSDYLVRDVPALASAVFERAGPFHFVGQSLGGVLGLPFAAMDGGRRLRSLVTLGSALHYGTGGSAFRHIDRARPLLTRFRTLPTRLVHRLSGPLSAAWLVPDAFHYNRRNMASGAVLAFHAWAAVDMTLEELLELGTTFEGEGIRCADLGRTLPELARRLPVPWLALAGTRDVQCPPATARWTFERVDAPRKEWVLAARGEGFSADYGHVDLVLGRPAAAEVWPRIEAFLAGRSPAVPALAGATGKPA